MEIITNFFADSFWISASFLATMTVYLTSTINAKFNLHPNKTWKQVMSWVVAVILTICAYYLNIINVAEPTWLSLLGIGIVVGLSSNGIYDFKYIKESVNKWVEHISEKTNEGLE